MGGKLKGLSNTKKSLLMKPSSPNYIPIDAHRVLQNIWYRLGQRQDSRLAESCSDPVHVGLVFGLFGCFLLCQEHLQVSKC